MKYYIFLLEDYKIKAHKKLGLDDFLEAVVLLSNTRDGVVWKALDGSYNINTTNEGIFNGSTKK